MKISTPLCIVVVALSIASWAQGNSADQDRSTRDIGDAAHPHQIAGISVCSLTGTTASISCGPGTMDTQQLVLAPSGGAINDYGGLGGLSDEHGSVFPPGSLHGNSDYVFFLASRTALDSDTGVVALSGGAGPNASGQWTVEFASIDNYGYYPAFTPAGFGQLFLPPTGRQCPTAPNNDVTQQDQTFDLNYAAAGSIVKDPTSAPGSLLMIYEGANKCPGTLSGSPAGGAYIVDAVATSIDYGHSWPTYRGSPPLFDFFALPGENSSQAPNQPNGAFGANVCMGNDCATVAPAFYGRYPVVSPPVSLNDVMQTGLAVGGDMGEGEPAAFVDDAAPGPNTFVYLIHGYSPGGFGDPLLPDGRNSDLTVARAHLNGGSAPLQFSQWDGNAFAASGLGGTPAQIFPDGNYENCGTTQQSRHMASLYYVQETQQYLLLFVCDSPTDPNTITPASGRATGAAWFYSTSYDLADPTQWTTPLEVSGTWSAFTNTSGKNSCPVYQGWYPTLMSLHRNAGRLSLSGYAFYLWGCQGNNTPPPGRRYASRAFTISVD